MYRLDRYRYTYTLQLYTAMLNMLAVPKLGQTHLCYNVGRSETGNCWWYRCWGLHAA